MERNEGHPERCRKDLSGSIYGSGDCSVFHRNESNGSLSGSLFLDYELFVLPDVRVDLRNGTGNKRDKN